jgi:alpha-tubulin suppressor-like RCC1 family protein
MTEIVSAWGDNSNGQLGDGTTTGRPSPAPVPGLEGVRTVESGSGHVVALLEDGTALAWGRNAFGQVGDGTVDVNRHTPTPVKNIKNIKAVVPGGGQTLYLLEDGTVWGAGGGFFGLLGPANMRLHPVPVLVDGIDEVVELISGGGHAIALRADGTVWTWGRDDYGQLGDGPDANDRVPGRTYQEHAGRGYDSRPAPTKIDGLGEVRSLAAGGGHSVAIQTDGTVWTWGDNDRGQLGHGDTEHLSSPKKVEGITTAVAATCAYHHTVVLLEDGTLQAFGINDRGQLGDGTTENKLTPGEVKGLSRVKLVTGTGGGGEVNPGNYGHTLALLEDGTVWSWGCNDKGELGNGTTDRRVVAEPVPGLTGVRHLTVGGEVPISRENPGGGYALAIHSA